MVCPVCHTQVPVYRGAAVGALHASLYEAPAHCERWLFLHKTVLSQERLTPRDGRAQGGPAEARLQLHALRSCFLRLLLLLLLPWGTPVCTPASPGAAGLVAPLCGRAPSSSLPDSLCRGLKGLLNLEVRDGEALSRGGRWERAPRCRVQPCPSGRLCFGGPQ